MFSILLTTALVLIRLSVPSGGEAGASWLTNSSRRTAVRVALNLVPVRRDRVPLVHRRDPRPDRGYEDRFFATVFLGSGILFVAMLFVAAAIAGALVAGAPSPSTAASKGASALARRETAVILNIYAMRMAAVFIISTATIAFRTKVMARWIALLGYAVALVLLLTIAITPWAAVAFPAWIMLVSVDTLVVSSRRRRAEAGPCRLPKAEPSAGCTSGGLKIPESLRCPRALDPSGTDRFGERRVVAFGLVRVRLGERRGSRSGRCCRYRRSR